MPVSTSKAPIAISTFRIWDRKRCMNIMKGFTAKAATTKGMPSPAE